MFIYVYMRMTLVRITISLTSFDLETSNSIVFTKTCTLTFLCHVIILLYFIFDIHNFAIRQTGKPFNPFFSSLDTIFIISFYFSSLIFFLVVVVWHLFFKHFSIWWCHFVFWSTLWFDGRQIDYAVYWNAASMEFIKTERANEMANIRIRLFKVNSKKEQSWLFTLSPIRQSTAAPHSATAQQLQ